jgi:hypothetical protein
MGVVMAGSAIPAVLSLVARLDNVAVDAALVESLVHLSPQVQHRAVGILFQRGHAPSLASIAGRFQKLSEPVQKLVVERIPEMFEAVRIAVLSENPDDREGAIELIRRSGTASLAYLLAEAVRAHDPRTREMAARALHGLAGKHVEPERNPTGLEGDTSQNARDLVAAALREAVTAWEMHFHPKVLEAALWMSDRLYPAIEGKVGDPRSRMIHMLTGLIQSTTDPRMTDFLVRALGHSGLRGPAAQAIGQASANLLRGVFQKAALLDDPGIERGFRFVKDCRWLEPGCSDVLDASAGCEVGAIRIVLATGGSSESKFRSLTDLVDRGSAALAQAIVAEVSRNPSPEASALLGWIAGRKRDESGRTAECELARRTGQKKESAASRPAPTGVMESAGGAGPLDDFERYWNQFEALTGDEREKLGAKVSVTPGVPEVLRSRLAGKLPAERFRAIQIAGELGLADELEEAIYPLAHDSDPRVRSHVMTVLAGVPGATSERLLRAGVHDGDERVQANAVDSLDRLEVPQRERILKEKLGASNNRVRANAVKSLLRLEVREAGETLVEMLGHPSNGQRLSAIWVVSRLGLRAVLDQVATLARSDPDERVRQRAKRVLRELSGDRHGHTPMPPSTPATGLGTTR